MNRSKFLKSLFGGAAVIAAAPLVSSAEALVDAKKEDAAIEQKIVEPRKGELPFVTTDEYVKDHNGMDGQYVLIPLTQPFDKYDIITNNFKTGFNFYVVDEPKHVIKRFRDGSYEEYYLHTTNLITNGRIDFCPRKYLLPGTQFNKVNNAI